MEEKKDKTSNASKPKIGKALKVGASPNVDEQTSEEVGETEENERKDWTEGFSYRELKILLGIFIICTSAIIIAFLLDRSNHTTKKSEPYKESIDNAVYDSLPSATKSSASKKESTTSVADQEFLRKNLDGSDGKQSYNELKNDYECVGSWTIASGFGKGGVSLFKKRSKYILVDYSQNMCYQMKPHKVKSNKEFNCYALNGVDNYFHVDKGLTIYINPNLQTAYDNNDNPYTCKLIFISGYGYTGICINDNSTQAGRNVYVEYLRLE